MATIVTRAGKGYALTHTEMDANFTNLQGRNPSVADYGAGNTTAAFQAAIDALPNAGGTILVPVGPDYSGVVPASLTVPLVDIGTGRSQRKMVQWDAKGVITLPRDMPGVVLRSGQHREYDAAGRDTGRYGDAFVHLRSDTHKPDPAATNQQDAVLHVSVEVADTGPIDHEMEAIKFDVTSKGSNAVASLRGIRGTIHGDGGSGKLRAARLFAEGFNSHDGILTGLMVGVTRSGLIPAAFGGTGDSYTLGTTKYGSGADFAIIAQAGDGIRGCFLAQGNGEVSAKSTPQSAFAMTFGAQAVLPTVAALDLHAGGSGRVMRLYDDENASNLIASIDKKGSASFKSFRSNVAGLTIANDAVATLVPPGNGGFLEIWGHTTSNIFGKFYFRATGAVCTAVYVGSATVVASTAALTGTTGVAGNTTISCNGGNILIENRGGGSRTFHYHFITE